MSTSTERMRRLRERRAAEHAAELAPVPDASPRDPDDCLLPAVEASIGALELGERDQAAAQLARRLAAVIDEAASPFAALRWLGPELLKCLESLGATPAARAKLPKPEAPRQPSQLDRLRSARAARPGAICP